METCVGASSGGLGACGTGRGPQAHSLPLSSFIIGNWWVAELPTQSQKPEENAPLWPPKKAELPFWGRNCLELPLNCHLNCRMFPSSETAASIFWGVRRLQLEIAADKVPASRAT